jgi:uridine kinase
MAAPDSSLPPALEPVSTWRQPEPPPAGPERTALIGEVAARITALSAGRLRVAVDGLTGSGKTSFGHELAAAVRGLGRPTLRASFDDFKNPWDEARQLGYDRLSGEGYYRNAYDFASARDLLLVPAGPQGSGNVVLRAHSSGITGSGWTCRPKSRWPAGSPRDTAAEGGADAATRLHRDRYYAAEIIYLAEVGPRAHADLVIDNEFLRRPLIL